MKLEIDEKLISARNTVLEKLKNLFKEKAIELHLSGSIARGDSDPYSDIDIWFTFNDDEFEKIKENRLEYYNQAGEIIHICEPPQNAPINGVHSALIIKENDTLIMVDVILCPQSTSFITKESRKIFGIDLPFGETSYNPQKIKIDEDYRINFFICFVFNAIKKIKRGKESPFKDVIREYNNLKENYNINVLPLNNIDLKEIIKNVGEVANEKQKVTLNIISEFAEVIFS